ncbi:hypothetical protein [Runella salmonicolor]|uniref:Outer membrane protein beta-barrel domain-containing protein n=1 Tax=Runella salmonicolor TaxID=2950278 RepID=A0ABT1FJK0_9BACT|nr:hypothetical protein [Runella salmonicolor]MCP1381952.1 hypothetical protein [Runella salmonicolor]
MLKTAISLILFYLSITITQAQSKKNKWYLGVGLAENYAFATIPNSKGAWSYLVEMPTIGYLIKENLAVSLGTSVHIPPKSILRLFDDPPIIYCINPALRYYFGKKDFKPYAQLLYRFGRENLGKYELRNPNGQLETYEYINRVQVIQIGGGAAYFFTPKMSIDLGIYLDKMFRRAKETYPDFITGAPLSPKTQKGTNSGFRLGLCFYF